MDVEEEKLLTISIIATNEKEILRKCLNHVRENISNNIDCEVYVVDNASSDGTSDMLKNEYNYVKVITNEKRKSYCENNNNIIRRSSGDHVLIMNADVFITKGFIEELLGAIGAGKDIGCVMGKLLLRDGNESDKVIDSTGLVIYRSRRTTDRGQGEEDKGQYDAPGEIFSASGAAMLCSREMLEDVKLFDEYFDESFYAHKEELDLCWRARLRGWKIIYDPKAIAYHLRGWGSGIARRKIPRFIRRHSYKNRYLMMIKDDHLINILKSAHIILWHELKALIYVIFREPHMILAWLQIILLLPLTVRKRREIMKKAIVRPGQIIGWFV